jgi:transposase
VARDWRDDRIDELERIVAERDRAQAAQIAELTATVARLKAKIAALEERLGKSSRNSSSPPSSDSPDKKKPRSTKKPSGRKPGAQPGHKRHERPLVPVEEVDKVVVLVPKRCEECATPLKGLDPDPIRHQVSELPEVKPDITEYRRHALDCGCCGHTTRAALPAGVPTRCFGPSVDATIAVLMGVYRLGKRPVVELMRDMYGLTMCLGSVIACQKSASEALAAPFDEAKVFAENEKVKHADETGWRENRKRAWLWAMVTSYVTVFMIQARRNTAAAQALLGKVRGVLVTDRHGAYNFWNLALRQVCWAHLERDIVAMSERGGYSAVVATAMLLEVDRMFAWWHRVRDGDLKRSTFRVYMRGLQKRFERLLEQGAHCSHAKTAGTCAKILAVAPALWTFVRVEGVEPTNNIAEQRVRHGVLMRKISYGTHSEAGSRFVERILTVHATLRSQHRSILVFVRDACRARLNGAVPPSLLPQVPPVPTVALAA